MKISLSRIAALTVLAGFTSMSAMAQDQTITLKFAHFLPLTHPIWLNGGKKFTDEVTSLTNGRVKFEVYPSNQLGSDALATLKSGLADITILAPSYQPDKLPLTSVAELPNMSSTSCEGTRRLDAIGKGDGILNQLEYRPQGFRPIFFDVLAQYKIMTTSRQINTPQDVHGVKIRANGVAMEKTIRALGAVPVKVVSGEMYDSLTRGTIDGGFYPYDGVKPYKLQTVIQNSVDGLRLGTGSIIFAISNKTWNGLPDDVKAAITKAGSVAQETLCQSQDDAEARLADEFTKQNNWKTVHLNKEQAAQWAEKTKSVTQDWAKELDRAGKKGTEVLNAYQNVSTK